MQITNCARARQLLHEHRVCRVVYARGVPAPARGTPEQAAVPELEPHVVPARVELDAAGRTAVVFACHEARVAAPAPCFAEADSAAVHGRLD